MSYPVKPALYNNGHLFSELIAENENDLWCNIEMDSGVGWLDVTPLYQKLQDKGYDCVTDTFRVCNSFEKWGEMQQEVVIIKARLQRMDVALQHPPSTSVTPKANSGTAQ